MLSLYIFNSFAEISLYMYVREERATGSTNEHMHYYLPKHFIKGSGTKQVKLIFLVKKYWRRYSNEPMFVGL